MLAALHGNDGRIVWRTERPIVVWLPASEAEFRRVRTNSSEQGLFQSGVRRQWIVVNPSTPNILDVLSHEYIHAVLAEALPNLPTWLEEGICELYSTVDRVPGGIRIGRPPHSRLDLLRRYGPAEPQALKAGSLDARGYATAWALVKQLESRGGQWWRDADLSQPLPGMATLAAVRTVKTKLAVTPSVPAALDADETNQLFAERDVALGLAPAVPDAVNEEFLRGNRLLDEGLLEEAIPVLASACSKRPANSGWWLSLALAYRESGKESFAREAAAKALAVSINDQERQAARSFLDGGR
jgi:hypothetical protein